MVFEHLTYMLIPGHFAEFRLALDNEGLPARNAVFGKPFGIYVTEIGPLNEVTLITAFADQEDYRRKQSILTNSVEWRNFENKVRAGIAARSYKLVFPAPLMLA
jgi:hypothetical protein